MRKLTQIRVCIYIYIYTALDLHMKSNIDNLYQFNYYLYLFIQQEANRFHEDIFGVSAKSEFTDKARDQAKRAWKYINSTTKPTNNKEVATPIPSSVRFQIIILE